jgi:cytochrome c553
MSSLIALPAIAAASDPIAGKLKSEDQRCQECHADSDRDHSSAPEFKASRLAGQYPEYILKQMRDFRSGARKHVFMAMMANSIEDADLADIAAYFAGEKIMQGDGTGDSQLAKNLYINGDAARNILPCMSCHGANGKGISSAGVSNPVIGGQEVHYLEKQLLDWRSGDRNNSTGGVMNISSKALTDAEIQALAKYISGL